MFALLYAVDFMHAEEQFWAVLYKLCKWEITTTLQSSFIQVRTGGMCHILTDCLTVDEE